MFNFTELTNVAYYDNCATLGLAVLEELIGAHGLDVHDVQDAAYDAVLEAVGESEMFIYSRYHLPILQHSSYCDSYVGEFGTDHAGEVLKDKGLDGLHAAIAFHCITADVMDWLNYNLEDIIESRIEALGGEVE